MLQIDAEVLRLYDLPPRLERQILDLFAGWERQGVPFVSTAIILMIMSRAFPCMSTYPLRMQLPRRDTCAIRRNPKSLPRYCTLCARRCKPSRSSNRARIFAGHQHTQLLVRRGNGRTPKCCPASDNSDADTPLRISAISWGEIEYGHRCVSDTDTDIQTACKDFVNKRLPNVLPIHQSTSHYYGQIRARLFEKFAPKNGRRNLRPCQLADPLRRQVLAFRKMTCG